MPEINIGCALRVLNHRIRRYIDNEASVRSLRQITGSNGWIIGYIYDHDGTDVFQRDLEKEFGITRSTASKVVDLMVKKGFLERAEVDGDRRLRKLVLTDRAREVSLAMCEHHKQTEKRLTAGFSPEELVQLNGYIERMLENFEER